MKEKLRRPFGREKYGARKTAPRAADQLSFPIGKIGENSEGPHYILSESRDALCRQGYIRVLRSDLYRLMAKGPELQVFAAISAAVDHKSQQLELPLESKLLPPWSISTSLYRIGIATNLHRETVKRALKYLENEKFIIVECYYRKLAITLRHNWDFFKDYFHDVTKSNTGDVTIKYQNQAADNIQENEKKALVVLPACDENIGKNVTVGDTPQAPKTIEELMGIGDKSVTSFQNFCDVVLGINTSVAISSHSDLVNTYYASLDEKTKANEQKHAEKLTSKKAWSRSQVEDCFAFVSGWGEESPPRVMEFLCYHADTVLPIVLEFYENVPKGTENEFFERTLIKFCDRYPEKDAQIEVLQKIHNANAKTFCGIVTSNPFVKRGVLWLWSKYFTDQPLRAVQETAALVE